MSKKQKVSVRGADGLDHELVLVRIESGTAYVCAESKYEEAVQHPESCIEVGFPVSDVRQIASQRNSP